MSAEEIYSEAARVFFALSWPVDEAEADHDFMAQARYGLIVGIIHGDHFHCLRGADRFRMLAFENRWDEDMTRRRDVAVVRTDGSVEQLERSKRLLVRADPILGVTADRLCGG